MEELVKQDKLYGVMAEFATPGDVVRATERAYSCGFRDMDAYSPTPVHGLAEAMGVHSTRVPLVVLIGAITGGLFGYGLQYYMSALSYVHNVGGRPVHSWPQFIPITFETTILFAAISAVVGMFAMNGLPRPNHPVFNNPDFAKAGTDRFFLCIEARDRLFEREATVDFLKSLSPLEVVEVHE